MVAKFKYTVDGGNFTTAQREFYEENGFIVFKKLVPDKVLDECIDRFVKICRGELKGEHNVFNVVKDAVLRGKGKTGEQLVSKIQDFLYDDILFEKYACNPEIVEIVKNIIGQNVTGAHSMLINKPPDSTLTMSRHPLHQDLHYFPFRPSNKIVASWTAMEKITEENGCLFVVPGSHKGQLFPHVYPEGDKNKFYHGVQGFDHIPRVNLVMEKGDTVFFHPLILHGSGPNLTKGFRKAISVHFANSNCEFIELKGTIQENIESELTQLVKKKAGLSMKFSDIWKMKSRLISGNPGTFQQLSSNL